MRKIFGTILFTYGKTFDQNIQVKVAPSSLVSVDEKEEKIAQKAFYAAVDKEMSRKKSLKLKFWQRVSLVYNPLLALTFASVYWFVGLKHAEVI